MKQVAALGSCLSGTTAVMLAGDYRWTRLNNAAVHRSDVFARYVVRGERMPSPEFVESVLALRPEHAAPGAALLRSMFRETVGMFEMPAGTRPLLENLAHERFDAIVLDNQFDTHAIKCAYRSLDGRHDFEFNFPLHWCERYEQNQDAFRWLPCLEPEQSGNHWAEIVRWLRAAQPAARIVFVCAPSSTILDDPARRDRADGFEAALRDALGDTDIEIFSQMDVPREFSKLPDDPEHFDLSIYRALAGRIFTSVLMTPRLGAAREAADAG